MKMVVKNESSEIIQMLNAKFNDIATNLGLDLYLVHLRASIDKVNELVYDAISNSVLTSYTSTLGRSSTSMTGGTDQDRSCFLIIHVINEMLSLHYQFILLLYVSFVVFILLYAIYNMRLDVTARAQNLTLPPHVILESLGIFKEPKYELSRCINHFNLWFSEKLK
ncbi:hypothetical protein ACJX0J_034460 [Zea mays]